VYFLVLQCIVRPSSFMHGSKRENGKGIIFNEMSGLELAGLWSSSTRVALIVLFVCYTFLLNIFLS